MVVIIAGKMMILITMPKLIAIMVSGLAGVEYRDVVQGLCGLQFKN